MNIHYLFALFMVFILGSFAYIGVDSLGMKAVFGVFLPYAAFVIFIVAFSRKLLCWVKSPVPFRIPSTCGQQQSLSWIKQNKIDNPSTLCGVITRMFFEIFLFRSLFRNTKAGIKEGRVTYEWEIWLWLSALAFHYSFFVVIVRHLRLFLESTPKCIQILESLDGFLQIGLPGVMISGFVLLGAVTFLLFRRIFNSQVKYVSLAADYFPLFLIIGIAGTGIYMRYFAKVDIVAIKELLVGLFTFTPVISESITASFYVHLFLVCVLFIYFPFSKLMHAGGIFLSPTRNLANNSRMVRHINPWNPDLKFHTYEAYENEFREKMIEAGLPVEKEA